jgi:hypothetical protein
MQLWNLKVHFDARYDIPAADAFHRIYDIASILVVGTAVLYIRPVSILSDPVRNQDIYLFALSITMGNILSLGRFLEVMFCQRVLSSPGLHPEAFVASYRTSIWISVVTILPAASAIYSAIKFYDESDTSIMDTTSYTSNISSTVANHGNDDQRFLASTQANESDKNADADYVPISLLFAGGMSSILGTLWLVFFSGTRGEDKTVRWYCICFHYVSSSYL